VRRLVVLVYALVFLAELLQAAIVPLLPSFTREFALSKVESGAVLAAAPFAMVVVSVPIGLLADRLGPRDLAAVAGGLLVVGALVQAFAFEFWSLFAGRVLYGASLGAVWTAGLALISDATSRRRAAALGGSVTMGGLAFFLGPASAGYTAEAFGLAVPFLAVAGASFVITIWLALASVGLETAKEGHQPLRETVGSLREAPTIKSALMLMVLLGLIVSAVQLLVPLQLDENGLSAGEIGALFTAASAVWIFVSAVTARGAERGASVRFAALGAMGLAGVLLLPVVSLATTVLAVFLLLRGAFGAALSTIAYPLSEAGAREAGLRLGAVLGLMNVCWGGAAFAAPVITGVLAEALGMRATFAIVAACALTGGAWIQFALRNQLGREKLGAVG
jgi:MFS family permease